MNGNEEKFRLIIEKISDGILVLDKDEKIAMVNPEAEDMFGIKGSDVLGKRLPEIMNPADFRAITSKFDFKKNWGIHKEETFENIKTSMVFEIDTISLKEGDKDFGKLLIVKDITRERNIEKTKDEFVALAAHQLRTPLSAIKWTLAILMDERAGKLNDAQKTIVEKSYFSNERMIRLINDLLNVAKFEEGKYIFSKAPDDLAEIAQEVADSFKEEIENKKIVFSFKKPTELFPRIKLDKEKIKLVIENFLENAIKYSPSGGEVTISLKSNKMEAELKVKDSGIGVPEDQKEKIFTKFFRSSNAVQIETDGSGLGLYLSKNIIVAHNGRIGFSSKENEGSTFWFTLPIKEEFEQVLERF